MARSRRGKGGGGTLGTLLRTTLAQVGTVRDALERGAREGRARLDDARLGRRHEEALAELGAIVLDRVRRGELADLEEIREIAEAIAAVEALESRLDDRDAPAAPSKRTIARRRDHGDDDGTVSSGAAWSPPQPSAPARVWRPTAPTAPHAPNDEVTKDLGPARGTHIDEEPGARFREERRPRAGGITFERRDETGPDPDDDLGEYMNPDDVPARDPKK
jgi:hypothetical protein